MEVREPVTDGKGIRRATREGTRSRPRGDTGRARQGAQAAGSMVTHSANIGEHPLCPGARRSPKDTAANKTKSPAMECAF